MPGRDYDSAINVRMCRNGVLGMSTAYEPIKDNKGLSTQSSFQHSIPKCIGSLRSEVRQLDPSGWFLKIETKHIYSRFLGITNTIDGCVRFHRRFAICSL